MDILKQHEEQLDFELQKYLGDILSDNLENEEFIIFMESVLNKYPLKGMLYSLVRVYDEVGLHDEAILKVENWLKKYPLDKDLQLLHEYLIDMNSLQ